MTSIRLKTPAAPPPGPPAYSGPAIRVPQVAVLDFETDGIESRPRFPPVPRSFSLQRPGERKPTFYAWGHPEGNNCEESKAREIIRDLWRWAAQEGNALLGQNMKFDCDVAETHFGVPRLPWDRVHDSMFLLFLHDPHAQSLSLKPAAERLLGMAPEEQDKVRQWLVEHKFVKANQNGAGAFICKAPGKVVAPYANGDVIRTKKLFEFLYKDICQRGMLKAYQREQRLMPILLDTERVGLRCDLRRMEKDFKVYQAALKWADNWLRKQLHAPDLNLDADKDVAEILDREGVVTEWTWTKGGNGRAPQRSVSKKNLTIAMFHNRRIALVHAYRVRLSTSLGMFMENFLRMAREGNGYVFTSWNQVRQSHGNDSFAGARTGRLSASLFMNIPKDFEDKDDGYEHPKFAKALPPLPLIRNYLLPEPGHVWLHRDFSQQELRVLAHIENGTMAERYRKEPRWDIHTALQQGLREIAGIELSRGGVKIVNFADIYGRGIAQMAESLGVDFDTVKRIRNAKNQLMPGVAQLTAQIKARGGQGFPIHTWGGREYYAEKPQYNKKYDRVMDFTYRLLNYAVQGGSADITKEAIIRYFEHPKRQARFLVTVHDELNASAPKSRAKVEMKILREAMEDVPGINVPMLSDGKTGSAWGSLEEFKD